MINNILATELTFRLKVKENALVNLGLIFIGSLFIAISAQLAVFLPFSPVPITFQTFAVLLTGAVLGPKRAALSLALYLLEGILGFPVFAGGTGGIGILFGPTGGYLIGFIPAAAAIGFLSEHGFDRKPASMAAAFIFSQIIIYFFGTLRLLALIDYRQVFLLGVYPFLIGDAIKAALVMILLPSCWKFLNRTR